jgi:transcriptional regulator with XRE-family HTH domain
MSDIPTHPVNSNVGRSDTLAALIAYAGGMPDLKSVGRRIASLRTSASPPLSQADLAAEIGCSRSTIAGIESGNDRGGILTMIAIADYFKVSLDWLLLRPVPKGGPLVGKFVDDPDVLAWIAFWERLSDADRPAALRFLNLRDVGKSVA